MINEIVVGNIYDCILELSSSQMQRNRWLSGEDRRISGYIELMCTLFDDCDFDRFIDKEAEKLQFSAQLIYELKLLRDGLNTYNEGAKSREEIIVDENWKKIGFQAQKVIDLWHNQPPKSSRQVIA